MRRRTKKLLIVLVIAPVLLASAAAGAYVLRQQRIDRIAREALVKGRAAYESGDLEVAMPLLARYVGRNQIDAEALVMLAECRAAIPKPDGGELVEAARYADRAIAVDPANRPALDLLLDLYMRLGFVTELNRVCDLLLDLEPNHRPALRAKTQALMVLGRYDDARRVAESLAAIEPASVDPFRLLLEIRRLQGATPADLASQAETLARANPDNFELQIIHAQTVMATADLATAARILARAASLTPTSLRAIDDALRLADALAILQRVSGTEAGADPLAAVRTILDRAASDESSLPAIAAIAAAWEWRKGQRSAAQQWLQRAEQATTSAPAPAVLGWRAVLAHESGDQDWRTFAKQVRTLEDSAAFHPPLWTPLMAAFDDIDEGKLIQARTHLGEALQASEQTLTMATVGGSSTSRTGPSRGQPRDPQRSDTLTSDLRSVSASLVRPLVLLHAGIVENELGDWRLAVQRWMQAGEVEPGWSLPIATAAATLLSNGQVRTAYDLALRAFSLRPGPFEAITLIRAAVGRQELGIDDPSMRPLLAELEAMDLPDPVRAEAVALRLRAAIADRDLPAVDQAATDLMRTTAPGAMLVDAATRLRTAGYDQWRALLDAASTRESEGTSARVAIFRANEAADAGRRDEALQILKRAAEQPNTDRLPLRFAEARIFARFQAADEARKLLRAISDDHAGNAAVQSEILQVPIAWTDAALVDVVIQRMRQATGDAGIEWKLADATRRLTFSPEPAKAQEVILRLNQVLRDDPRNAHALSLLSDWMVILGDANAAIDYMTRAVDIPDAPSALYPKLIDMLRRAGRQEDARTRLLQFSAIPSIDIELRRTRARLLAEPAFRMIPEARRDLEFLATSGTVDDRLAFAAFLIDQRDSREAADILQSTLASATPASLPRERFTAALALLVEAGEQDRALELLNQRARSPGSDLRPSDRATILERVGRLEEAEQSLIAAANTAPPSAQAWAELARFHLRHNQTAKARDTIAQARSRGIAGPELDSVSAITTAMSEGVMTEQQQQAVIDAIPPGPTRDLAEATRWFDQNPDKPQEFIRRLRAITAADPQLQLAWQFLVQTLVDSGEIEQAVAAARAAAAALPYAEVPARMEASTLLLLNRLSEARAAAARWHDLADDPFDAAVMRADIDLREGRTESALAILRPLADRNATRARELENARWASLVAAFAKAGDTQRARQLAALRDQAEPGWLHIQAAIAAGDAMPIDQARAWLSALEPALAPQTNGPLTLAQAYTSLAERSKSSQDHERALALLMPRITAGQATPFEVALAAGILSELQRHSEAVEMYQRALRADPNLWIALNNLAYLVVEQSIPGHDPITMAKQAAELAEKQGVSASVRARILHTLASAELAAGQAPAALASARQAIALDQSFASARLIEIEALISTGDMARARANFADVQRRVEAGLLSVDDKERARIVSIGARVTE